MEGKVSQQRNGGLQILAISEVSVDGNRDYLAFRFQNFPHRAFAVKKEDLVRGEDGIYRPRRGERVGETFQPVLYQNEREVEVGFLFQPIGTVQRTEINPYGEGDLFGYCDVIFAPHFLG